jgi:hypothetical protein
MAAETISFRTVDWRHVEGPEPADAADVNREVKSGSYSWLNAAAWTVRLTCSTVAASDEKS